MGGPGDGGDAAGGWLPVWRPEHVRIVCRHARHYDGCRHDRPQCYGYVECFFELAPNPLPLTSPEPSSLVLRGSGLAVLAGLARRKIKVWSVFDLSLKPGKSSPAFFRPLGNVANCGHCGFQYHVKRMNAVTDRQSRSAMRWVLATSQFHHGARDGRPATTRGNFANIRSGRPRG